MVSCLFISVEELLRARERDQIASNMRMSYVVNGNSKMDSNCEDDRPDTEALTVDPD